MSIHEDFFYNNAPQHVIDMATADIVKSGLTFETLHRHKIRVFQGNKDTLKTKLGYHLLDNHDVASTFYLIEIPYYDKNGTEMFTRYKLLNPPVNEGKSIKYLHPKSVPARPYIPAETWEIAEHTNEPLYITEGEKKALKLLQHGRRPIAVSGVFNFRGGYKTAGLPDRDMWKELKDFKWWGRMVFIAYDSDTWKNVSVQEALWELTLMLMSKNAHVHIISWSPACGKGIDEYLHYIETKVVTNDVNIELSSLETTAPAAIDTINIDQSNAIIRALAVVHLPKAVNDSIIAVVAKVSHSTKTMVRNAIQDHPQARKREASQKATKDNPDYWIDEHNAWYLMAYKKDGTTHATQIATFHAEIIGEQTQDDGSSVIRKVFTLQGKGVAGILPPIEVPAEEFSKLDWVVARWGNNACIRTGKKDFVREAIMRTSDPKETQEYIHTGWHTDKNGTFYLTGGGAVGRIDANVTLGNGLEKYHLPLNNTKDDVQRAGKAALTFLEVANPAVSIPLFATVFLCPLVSMFAYPPNFSLFLYGKSGVFKSTFARLMLSFFGTFNSLASLPNFTDTSNSIELNSHILKDTLMVIDDLHPSTDKRVAQDMVNICQRLIYQAANRTGRGRNNSDSTAKTRFFPRGMLCITSEQKMDVTSTIARLFTVEITKNDVRIDKLSEIQEHAHLLPVLMAGFIQYLQKNYAEWCIALSEEFLRIRKQCHEKQKKNIHMKIPEQEAFMALALNTVLTYMEKELGIIDDMFVKEIKRKHTLISNRQLIEARQNMLDGEPILLMFQIIEALVLTEQTHFLPKNATSYVPAIGNPNQMSSKCMGWVDEKHVYVNPTALPTALATYSRQQGKEFPIPPRQLGAILKSATSDGDRILADHGKIEVAKTVNVNGFSRRVLVFHRKHFKFGTEIEDETGCNNEEENSNDNETEGDLL